MRKITANYLFVDKNHLLKNGILVLDDDHRVLDVIDTGGTIREIANLEYHSGLLVPGFVDCFCQLEAVGDNFQFHPGMETSEFYKQLERISDEINAGDLTLIAKGVKHLKFYGTAACADFFPSETSIKAKINSAALFRNIVSFPEESDSSYKKKLEQFEAYKEGRMELSPWKKIGSENWQKLLSHSTYSALYCSASNTIDEHIKPRPSKLVTIWDTPHPELQATGVIPHFWVLSPRLFQYLHGDLPTQEELSQTPNLCLGTGNLSIHRELSIFEEMKFLQLNRPELPLLSILSWGTVHGAIALGLENELGSFEVGKKPGVNLLTKMDLTNLQFRPESKLKVLV